MDDSFPPKSSSGSTRADASSEKQLVEFEIITPTGQPVVFEMWAMPTKDPAVMNLYQSLKTHLDEPKSLIEVVKALPQSGSYAALFVPGGHGAMLGIPEDRNVGRILRWANAKTCSPLVSVTVQGHCYPRIGRKRFYMQGTKWRYFPTRSTNRHPLLAICQANALATVRKA